LAGLSVAPPVLLAVGHGTRDPAGTAVTEALLELVRNRAPELAVQAAYVDNSPPSVGQAFDRLARDGVTQVVALPMLLSAASHSKTNIAGSVQAARQRHPEVVISYGRPLGPHPALIDVVVGRLAEAGVQAGAPGTGVVLAAGGSADPDANADIAKTARLLWEGRGWLAVEVAFASATGPRVDEVVRRLRAIGADRVAVAPYFLAPGFLPAQAVAGAAGADVVTQVLGAHPALAGLLLERYAEAIDGDIRMNCDSCLHRVPFPGREAEVGARQRPHAHPAERASQG